MKLFLQMVGAVFVGLFFVVVVAYFWLRWKLKRWTNDWASKIEGFAKNFNPAMAGLVYVPPMTLELSPAAEDDAPHRQEFELATLEVQNLGFDRGDLFAMGEIGGVCRGLFHPTLTLDAAVFDHPLLNVWVEFNAKFADGTSLNFSNCQQVSTLDRPPGRDSRFFPGEQIAVLWERFRNELPNNPRAEITPDGFQERFERSYREEMEWRIARGGVTEEEIRRTVAAGGGELMDEHRDAVQQAWRMRIAQHIDEQLRSAFLSGTSMSLAEYENARDRLVFIHDRTSPEQLLIYMDLSDDDEDREDDDDAGDDFFGRQTKLRQRCQTSSPRVVFRELQAAHELQGTYKLLQELTTPYPADVYLASREP